MLPFILRRENNMDIKGITIDITGTELFESTFNILKDILHDERISQNIRDEYKSKIKSLIDKE